MAYCPDINSACCPDYANTYQPCCFDGVSTSVEMPVFTANRARLFVGGSFFRSVFISNLGNSVTIQIDWLESNGITITTNELIMEYVRLTVTGLNENNTPYSNTYTVTQSAIFDDEGSIYTSGIPAMRALVNTDNSAIITMADLDETAMFVSGVAGSPIDPEWSYDGEALMTTPQTSLIGATGPPEDQATLDSINTSMAVTLCFISVGEWNSPDTPQTAKLNDGKIDGYNAGTLEWEGNNWRAYTPAC